MLSDLTVRQTQRGDVASVAMIHTAVFPESAITKLGHKAAESYYLWLLDDSHDALNLVAEYEDRIVGYISAGKFRGATSGFLRKNRKRLFLGLLRRPSLIMDAIFRERVRAGVGILRGKRSGAAPSYEHPGFGILAIAVHPSAQRMGVAALLVQRAEQEARTRGSKGMILTVALGNSGARTFYEKLGWRTVATDSRAATMIIEFGDEAPIADRDGRA